MKKLGLLVLPLMTISLLANCGGKEPTKVSYTLTYTYDNGTDDKYVETYAEDKSTVKPTWEPTYPSYTFDGWFTKSGKEGDLFTFGNTLSADTVIFAHWSKKPAPETTYTITFKNDDEEDKKIENIKAGSIVTDNIPTPSSKEGFTFIGWCTDTESKNPFDFNTIKIYQDYTLYSGWKEIEPEPTTYTITFKNDGDEDKKIENIKAGSIVTENIPTPSSKEGFTFIGWCTDTESKNPFDFNTIKIYQDYTLYSGWKEIEPEPTTDNVIIFRKDGERDIVKFVNSDNLSFTAPTFTSTTHYNGKWYCEYWGDSGKYLDSGETCNDLTLKTLGNYTFVYQETEIDYTITFKKSGEQDITRTVNLSTLSFTAPTFTSTTHYDGEWYCEDLGDKGTSLSSGETCAVLTSDNLDNYTFVYQETETDYTITFKKDRQVFDTKTVKLSSLSFTAPKFTSTTHYDGEWYCEDLGDKGTSLSSGETCNDLTLDTLDNYTFVYQEKPHEYSVTFEYADGTTESVVEHIALNKLTITAPTTKMDPQEGKRSVWKSDDLIIDSNENRTFDKSELKDYVFTETEEDGYSITYILGDEDAHNPETNPIKYKTTEAVTLLAPSLAGFTFKGWYLSDNERNKFQYQDGWAAGEMTSNITLYADWHITDKTLNDYSWSEISDISNSGEASKYFDIGETKTITIANANHQVRIIDYNYDVLTPSNDVPQYAGITFDFVNTISGYTTYWNNKDGESSKNYEFIHYSDLNDCLQKNGEVYNKINSVDGLMNAIKSVTKYVETSTDKGKTYKPTSYNTKLFPLSYDEIDGNDDGTYEYYKTNSQNRRKKGADYWLRSPYTDGSHSAWYCGDDGYLYFDIVYSYEFAVAPAFCI